MIEEYWRINIIVIGLAAGISWEIVIFFPYRSWNNSQFAVIFLNFSAFLTNFSFLLFHYVLNWISNFLVNFLGNEMFFNNQIFNIKQLATYLEKKYIISLENLHFPYFPVSWKSGKLPTLYCDASFLFVIVTPTINF